MSLRVLAKSALIYGVGNVGVRACTFLLLPLFTRLLSMDDFGRLATLLVTGELHFIVMHMGLRTAVLRFWSSHECLQERRGLLASAIGFNIVAGLLVVIVSVFLLSAPLASILHIPDARLYLLLVGLSALLESLFVLLITEYRADNRPTRYILSNLLAAVLLIGGNLLVLLVSRVTLASILGVRLGAFGAIFAALLTARFLAQPFRPRISTGLTLVRFGFPLIFSMSAPLFLDLSTLYLLGYLNGPANVALYSLGAKIASIVEIVLIASFQIAYEPYLFSHLEDPRISSFVSRTTTYLVLCFTSLSFFLLLGGRILTRFLAPADYQEALIVAVCLLPVVGFRGAYYVGEGLLTAKQKSSFVGVFAVAVLVLSISLNVMMIPLFGFYGAVVSAILVAMVRGIVILGRGTRLLSIRLEPRLWSVAGVFTLFCLSGLLASPLSAVSYFSVNVLVGLFGACLLYLSAFFTVSERDAIRDLAGSCLRRGHSIR